MIPTKFGCNWPSGFTEEVENVVFPIYAYVKLWNPVSGPLVIRLISLEQT